MKTTYKNLTISSKYLGNKAWSANDRNDRNYNNHVITVKNNDTKSRCTFEFWASIASPVIESENDLLYAFECFIRDAMSAEQGFEDFCSEFGYDSDSRSVERIYKACERALNKFDRVVSEDIYEFSNELQETIEAL